MPNILTIDPNKMSSEALQEIVKGMGHGFACVYTLKDGLKRARSGIFDVIFLAVNMPDGNGLDALPEIIETRSFPEVIMIADFGDPDEAEAAIKNGAWDYIKRPSSIHEMKLSLVRAIQYREKKRARRPSVVLRRASLEGIIGGSPQMRACMDLLAQAANSDAAVLITGETGTGKELFTRAIHDNSPRANGNFVVVDCTALPKTLVESMLFGYEKGAFTGADRARDGLLKQASGGTLFLDEVAELPLPVQKAFLRVLQERRFRPLGSRQELESDFRVVAASNHDLDARVRRRRFRKDLLFRLRSFSIELPPLRERPEDIRELAEYYIAELCERYGMGAKEFSPGFFDALAAYNWPGNVRELIHALERALVAARHEPVLFPKHLPTYIRVNMARASVEKEAAAKAGPPAGARSSQRLSRLQDVREAAIAEVEQQYLRELVSATGGNIKEACQISGLSRSRLYALLKKYELSTVG